jgi:saccharopine dehydrogenase-like NADP-dependent oxidoreductase
LLYTDVAPHLMELGWGIGYERIAAQAQESGSRVVLGSGLVPGISNVMVRVLAEALGGVDTIETALLLSARDLSGPASFDYFLKELEMPFSVHIGGVDRPSRPFSDPRVIEFPAPLGHRAAYLFPFSDQVLYPHTAGARTALTRLALDPPALGRMLGFLVGSGTAGLLARKPVRRALARRRGRRAGQPARFALRVEVSRDGNLRFASLAGHGQAEATATGAVAVARSLLEGEVADAGAWMPEQVIDPSQFFTHLARHGLSVEL